MTPLPHLDPDFDTPTPAPRNPAHALGWAAASGVVFCASAALGLAIRGEPFDGVDMPVAEALGTGTGIGLAAALFLSLACGQSLGAAIVFSLIACVTGGACGALAEMGGGASEIGFLAAFALVGLVAGFAGWVGSRRFAVAAPDDENSPSAAVPSHGLRAALAGLVFVVAAIVGKQSGVGWLVLAVGGFGVVVALILIGQERRVTELERRIRRLEADSPREDGAMMSSSHHEND